MHPQIIRAIVRKIIKQSQASTWLFFLVLILAPRGALNSVEIPFFAGFHSDNHVSYYPEREIREFDWDEKYRLCFGVDDLRYKNFGASLKLSSRANFIQQQVLIDSLELSWIQEDLVISGISRPQGIGSGYFFQQLYVANPAHNAFLYDQTRYNGLQSAWLAPRARFVAGLGGNTHNQAMGYLAASGEKGDLAWFARLDGKTRDIHWTTANFVPSAGISYRTDRFHLRTDMAYKYVFAHEDRQSHQEFFHVSEARLDMKNLPEIILSLVLRNREHSPKRTLEANAGLQFRLSSFALVPAYHYSNCDEAKIHKLDFLASWNPRPQVILGLYSSYEYPQKDQNRFTLGLQSSLRLDF